MENIEFNTYQKGFASLVALTDDTARIVLVGSAEEKKQELLKQLGSVSSTNEHSKPRKKRKLRA